MLQALRKALLLPRVNLSIADDVGLGKTIQAGLIVRELLNSSEGASDTVNAWRKIKLPKAPTVMSRWVSRSLRSRPFGVGAHTAGFFQRDRAVL